MAASATCPTRQVAGAAAVERKAGTRLRSSPGAHPARAGFQHRRSTPEASCLAPPPLGTRTPSLRAPVARSPRSGREGAAPPLRCRSSASLPLAGKESPPRFGGTPAVPWRRPRPTGPRARAGESLGWRLGSDFCAFGCCPPPRSIGGAVAAYAESLPAPVAMGGGGADRRLGESLGSSPPEARGAWRSPAAKIRKR